MPFTISHAAAVLPLQKSRLPLAALMIGSMSPDFPYFLPLGLGRGSTHDLDGILFFCWPVGLAVWLLFVHLLERPTIELLPAAWRVRVTPSDRRLSFKALALASIAVIVGAMTHVTWDAFTHGNTIVTETFPALTTQLFEYHGRAVRVYFVLQILSSIAGLFALWLWALRLRQREPQVYVAHASVSLLTDRARIVAALAVIAASGVTALLSFTSNSGIPIQLRVFHTLVGGITGWLLAWCVVAMLVTRTAKLTR
jgi:hypothetical protein